MTPEEKEKQHKRTKTKKTEMSYFENMKMKNNQISFNNMTQSNRYLGEIIKK